MQTVILNSESKADMKLLLELAKKIGFKAKLLSSADMEEIGLANAIKLGRTQEYIDTNAYLKKLRK